MTAGYVYTAKPPIALKEVVPYFSDCDIDPISQAIHHHPIEEVIVDKADEQDSDQ